MSRLFIARSHLMHSRWFVRWFNSPYYLARCGMKVTWQRDPIACWELAKSYMEEGRDQFGSSQITMYMSTRFRLAERFIVLVRLYKLARTLELSGLMDDALTVLRQTEDLISPANVIILARYIFNSEDHCENMPYPRKWCLKLVSKHYDWLSKSYQWADCIVSSVPELAQQWNKITANKKRVSQEKLRNISKLSLAEAETVIDSGKSATPKLSPSALQEPENEIAPHLSPPVSRKENSPIRSVIEVSESPRKRLRPKKSNSNLNVLHQVQAMRDDTDSEKGIGTESLRTVFPSRKSSLRNTLDVQGSVSDKPGDRSTVFLASPPLAKMSSFREDFEVDPSHDTVVNQSKEVQSDGVFDRMISSLQHPVSGTLSGSISEPLLSSRRFEDISRDAPGSPLKHEIDARDHARPASVPVVKAQEGPHLRRGVIMTVEDAEEEADKWPLADIPLPDPLLPGARRAPSLDSEGTVREHVARAVAINGTNVSGAKIVTIFGVHRPGMGGSIVSVDKDKAAKQSLKRSPNHAKAREFLGIDNPAPHGNGVMRHSESDVEGKKLRKKREWLPKPSD